MTILPRWGHFWSVDGHNGEGVGWPGHDRRERVIGYVVKPDANFECGCDVVLMHRFYTRATHDTRSNYFWTTHPNAENAPEFIRDNSYTTDRQFYVLKEQRPKTVALHRFFEPVKGLHLYEAGPSDPPPKKEGWRYDGPAGWIFVEDCITDPDFPYKKSELRALHHWFAI